MAERPPVKTRPITRGKLSSFLPTHELIKAFENLSEDVSQTLPDAIEGSSVDASTVIAGAMFQQRQPPMPAPSIDSVDAVMAGAAFQPRTPTPPAEPPSALQTILANQIFGG
jgi:hypothetical protein